VVEVVPRVRRLLDGLGILGLVEVDVLVRGRRVVVVAADVFDLHGVGVVLRLGIVGLVGLVVFRLRILRLVLRLRIGLHGDGLATSPAAKQLQTNQTPRH
jgi:hypothetical protein